MSEIRVDPLSGLRTIVAPGRAARNEQAGDPFAEGNESQTPPELYAIRPPGSAVKMCAFASRADTEPSGSSAG